MPRLLPPRPFGSALAFRAALVWLFLRGAMAVGSAALEVPFPRALIGTPLTSLWLAAATIAAVWFELWRQRELIFLANLGYSFSRLGTVVAVECVALELALRLPFA